MATDNLTAVAHINHQGGARSMTFLDTSYGLFELVRDLGVTLQACHIPGRLSCLVDLLSRRDSAVNTEWTLCSRIAEII